VGYIPEDTISLINWSQIGFNRDSRFMLSQAWHPLINVLKRLINTQINGSREDTEQGMKRRQVK
jgi:hypothetical protein